MLTENVKVQTKLLTLLLSVMLLVGISNYAHPLPDKNLERAIRQQLNLNAGTQITQAHLSSLTSLTAMHVNIADLTGLQHATELTELVLRGNNISDLSPLAGLTNLTELNLGVNNISDASPLSELTNLEILVLDGNSITDFAFLSDLTNLEDLALSNNGISTIEPFSRLTSLTNLEHLSLADNELSEVSQLMLLTNLKHLVLTGNTISNLRPLSGLSNLESLILENNNITDLSPLSSLSNLKFLSIADNNITDLSPLSSLSNLKNLYISDNPVGNAYVLYDLPSLIFVSGYVDGLVEDERLEAVIRETLNFEDGEFMSHRYRQSLTTLRAGKKGIRNLEGLQHFTNLEKLWISGQNLRGISFSPLSELPNLKELYLGGSSLRRADLFGLSALTQLERLQLAWNNISDVTPLSSLTNLTDLGLAHNSISDVTPLSSLTSLEKLSLQGNPTTDFRPLLGLTNLTDLDVDIEHIADPILRGIIRSALGLSEDHVLGQDDLADVISITDKSLTSRTLTTLEGLEYCTGLESLILTHTQVSDLGPLSGLTNLETVDLSLSRPITDLGPLSGLTNLKTLILNNCRDISDISSLSSLTSLTRLELGDNNITDVSPLSGLTNLKTLILNHNYISDISSLSSLTSLKFLRLNSNEIRHVRPLSSLTSLKWLYLGKNPVTDFRPLLSLQSLSTIDVTLPSIFTDSVLAEAVRTALDLDSGAEITTTDLATLTELQVRKSSVIRNLVGLDYATGLESLILGGQTELSADDLHYLVRLPNLTRLSLGGTNATDRSVRVLSDFMSLTHLTLSWNNITDIRPLWSMTTLTDLRLTNNNIEDVSALSNLTALTTLFLKGNSILDTSPLYPLLEANGGNLTTIDIIVSEYPPWDVNEDGVVDLNDFNLVRAARGQEGNGIVDPRTDVNGDGIVNNDDAELITFNLDDGTIGIFNAPSVTGNIESFLDLHVLETLDIEDLEAFRQMLFATGDGSLKYQKALAILDAALAALQPSKTVLLANYPNPFNPETWIPYQLSVSSDVEINIYDIHGQVVRRLELGPQPVGSYTSRGRAAYWDGRNDVGEHVSSGIYFYELRTKEVSLLRKMVIFK